MDHLLEHVISRWLHRSREEKKEAYRDLSHAKVLTSGSLLLLRGSVRLSVTLSRAGVISGSEVVNHLGIKLLDGLGLGAVGSAAVLTGTTATTSLGISSGLVGSSRLGLGLGLTGHIDT